MLLGAYWVLYPGKPSARADAFIARLDSQCSGWRDRPFILQVDCEEWGGDSGTVPGKADIQAFCLRLRARMPKLRPLVYAPKWVYGGSLAGLSFPLWASQYVGGPPAGFRAMYPGNSSSKWSAYSGQVPAILQYTSSAGIGGQSTCDANAFRGTLSELTALAAPGWAQVSEDIVIEQADVAKIAAAVWAYQLHNPYSNVNQPAGTILEYVPSRSPHDVTQALVKALGATVAAMAVTDAVDTTTLLAAIDHVDEEVVATLTHGTTEEVAAALSAALGDNAVAVAQAILAAHSDV